MRKVIAAFFITIFLFNVIGGIAIFLLIEHRAQENLEVQLRKNIPLKHLHLVRVRVSDKYLYNSMCKGEFNINGELYDVARVIKTSNGIFDCYCLADHNEEKMLSDLNAQMGYQSKGRAPDATRNNTLLKHILKAHFFKPGEDISLHIISNNSSFPEFNVLIKGSGFIRHDFAPPQVA